MSILSQDGVVVVAVMDVVTLCQTQSKWLHT